jgi:glycosyltransferase involved in cell wall biosynthesis
MLAMAHIVTPWRIHCRRHLQESASAGYLAEPWDALRALDVNVLASIGTEGTPQALYKRSSPAAVIGSQSGGIAEVITHEKTGLLVPQGDIEALSAALLRLLVDRQYAAFLACNARAYVWQHHTLDIMGQKILTVYRALLDGR